MEQKKTVSLVETVKYLVESFVRYPGGALGGDQIVLEVAAALDLVPVLLIHLVAAD